MHSLINKMKTILTGDGLSLVAKIPDQSATNGSQIQVCNYQDNYYGDQVCILAE